MLTLMNAKYEMQGGQVGEIVHFLFSQYFYFALVMEFLTEVSDFCLGLRYFGEVAYSWLLVYIAMDDSAVV